jgi:hypothetical protein
MRDRKSIDTCVNKEDNADDFVVAIFLVCKTKSPIK